MLHKIGFYRQKTQNSDKYSAQMSDCKLWPEFLINRGERTRLGIDASRRRRGMKRIESLKWKM
jgi:hypothetical protein